MTPSFLRLCDNCLKYGSFQTTLQTYDNQKSTSLAPKSKTNKETKNHQWSRIESPEMNPQLYGQSIYDKKGKNIHEIKAAL